MRVSYPFATVLRHSLTAIATLLITSCGDGSTFYSESVTTDNGNDSEVDSTSFSEYTPGIIADYPLSQAPATGARSLTWLIAEVNGRPTPADALERIQATNNGFNRYANKQSRGAFELADVRISPALQISTTNTDLPALSDLQQLARAAATDVGFEYDGDYTAYLIVADGLEGVLVGDGQSGNLTVSPDFQMPETIHEMFHMLSIGNANAVEGGDSIFPGQIAREWDPYHFMGEEGSTKDCQNESTPCAIHATLSIPHKGRAGWLDANEVIVSGNTGLDKIFRIYNHDNFDRVESKPLTVYLTDYDPDGLFAVSYLTNTQSGRITTTGVMVHYVSYDSPADSHLIDLTPDSITTNNELPSDPDHTSLHDFGDAAVTEGALIDVAGMFTLEVIDTGLANAEDHWADIRIKPASCIYPARDFSKDDFDTQPVSNADEYCQTTYSYDWGIKSSRAGEISKADVSLEYREHDLVGGSLQLAVDDNATESLGMNRPLAATYSDGDTLWVSYLLLPRQIGDGHMLLYPNSAVEAGIGKRWGDQFAIGNESATAPQYPIADEVTWLVGKYQLEPGPDTITFWVNPETGVVPAESTAYAVRADIDIGDIDSLSINLNHSGDGAYDIDRVYSGANFTDISNVLAPAIPAPLIALHYDVSPDLDDLQAIAAGANLSDQFGIEPAVVIGTYGVSGQFQHGDGDPENLDFLYLSATNMLGQGANAEGETRREKGRQVADAAYGEGAYLDTGNGWDSAVDSQAEKFWASLHVGGEVMIADGGPMDFTANVLTRLQSHYGATDADLKRVTVVQHSLGFNVTKSLPENIQKIRDMANYVTIDNGNVGGNSTANLKDSNSNTTTSHFAQWARNNNRHADAWNSALDDFTSKIDFSDTVEYLYILDVPLDLVSDITTFTEIFD